MKPSKSIFPIFGILSFVLAHLSYAQQLIQVSPGDVKIKSVEKEIQPTPNFSGSGTKDKKVSRPREWLELEMEFTVDVKRAPRNAVLPELVFRYYVGMIDAETKKPLVLTGDVIHTNIIIGETYNSAMYVPPSTMGKITGDFRNTNVNAVVEHGVEVLHDGVLVGLWSTKGNTTAGKFWAGQAIQPGILSREKTPFGILWIDRYPEIKEKQ